MPEMDGIKAAELMSTEMTGIGIIMMSVQGEQDYLRRAMLAGAREFLVKPFSGDDLVRSIRHVYRLESSKRSMAQAMQAPTQGMGASNGKNGDDELARVVSWRSSVPREASGAPCSRPTWQWRYGSRTRRRLRSSTLALLRRRGRHAQPPLQQDHRRPSVQHMEDLDPDLLNDIMVTHSSGVKVLLAPPQPEMAELVTAEHVRRILVQMSAHFDYV